MISDRRTMGILFQAAAWLDRLTKVDLDSSEGAKAIDEAQDVIDQLDEHLPDWREHQPPRTKAERLERSQKLREKWLKAG